MHKNKLKLEPCYKKRELQSWSHTHENQVLRRWSRSHVHNKKSSRDGPVSILQQLCSLGL